MKLLGNNLSETIQLLGIGGHFVNESGEVLFGKNKTKKKVKIAKHRKDKTIAILRLILFFLILTVGIFWIIQDHDSQIAIGLIMTAIAYLFG